MASRYFFRLKRSVGSHAGRGSTRCPSELTPPNSRIGAYGALVDTAPLYWVFVTETTPESMLSRSKPDRAAGGSPGAEARCTPGPGPLTSYQNGVPAFL